MYDYANTLSEVSVLCYALTAALMLIGAVKLFMSYKNIEKGRGTVTVMSFVLSITAVLFLTTVRMPYAVTVAFLLLVIKGIMIFKAR